MTYLELFILAISLSIDTFAVSISGGIVLHKIKKLWTVKIMSFLALFQAGFLFAGWLLGKQFASIITDWDHWFAFVILTYIGGKMILDFFKVPDGYEKKNSANILNTKKLIILSVATSIDAIAVGISLAFINIIIIKIYFVTLITFIITAFAAYIGLTSGQKLGNYVGKRAELIGGIILIFIGIRILIEHLGLLGLFSNFAA
ncbi:MAG: manganese efflux pump [Bacteroidales bacterium]